MKGSHNTLSYGRPRHWWWLLLVPFWRCQSKSLEAQAAAGVRAFDVRFLRTPRGWRSAHGLVELAQSPLEAIAWIAQNVDGACVRCILERGDDGDIAAFGEVCRHLERSHPGVRFFEGIHKPSWRRVHVFGRAEARELERTEIQHYGSHYAAWKGLFPWLWQWLHRGDEIPAESLDDVPVFRDFR